MIRIAISATLLAFPLLANEGTKPFNPDPPKKEALDYSEYGFYEDKYGLDAYPEYQEEGVAEEIFEQQENPSIADPVELEFHTPDYFDHPKESSFPHTETAPNRWHLDLQWPRYQNQDAETPYSSPKTQYTWHPYYQSLLKGDFPIAGNDLFLSLTAGLLSEFSLRDLPTPSGISASEPGSYNFFGSGQQTFFRSNLLFRMDFFRGETSFKPVEWLIRLEPVFSVTRLSTIQTGIVSPDPRGKLGGFSGDNPSAASIASIENPSDVISLLGNLSDAPSSFKHTRHTRRTKSYLALQEAFVEVHLLDLSANYDFIAIKAGNQLFNSDFRGLIFNDTNTGIRLLGSAQNNLYQYNLAFFTNREKDTNTELNTFKRRRQYIVAANIYRQDCIWKGYTAELNYVANIDHSKQLYYDKNGFLARPSPIGDVRPHKIKAHYLGWAGEGHIGRVNISHAFYQAWGHDEYNGIRGGPASINAQLAACELSYDQNWIRYKLTGLYASGDSHPTSGKARGFDSISDQVNYFGGPSSYFLGQGFNSGGSAVALTQPLSPLTSMKTNKFEGQANFVNPGVFMSGVGTELELTPKLRAFGNFNWVRLMTSAPIEKTLMTGKIHTPLGFDVNTSIFYRPLLTDNIIFLGGIALFIPQKGFKEIYKNGSRSMSDIGLRGPLGNMRSVYYSGFVSLTLTY